MLAVVLYTGCDCNYAMCAAERDGDRRTWKWFSDLLYRAIFWLGVAKEPALFSGERLRAHCVR